MAHVFETSTKTFTVENLRQDEAARLRNARGDIPLPIRLAYGPSQVAGPAAGAVGANEVWGVNITVPSSPEVVWVIVSVNYIVQLNSAAGAPQKSFWFPIGDDTDATNTRPPLFGYGSSCANLVASGAGTMQDLLVSTDPSVLSTGGSCWYPIDPAKTATGFVTVMYNQVPAAGMAQNTAYLELEGIRLLGFPVELWQTGTLWMPSAARGS